MWSRFTKLAAITLSFLSLNCASYTNCIGIETLKDSIINITHKHNKTLLPYESFVKLEKRYFDNKQEYFLSTFASGTIIRQTVKNTFILTAKHFCDDLDDMKDVPKQLLPFVAAIGIWDQQQNLHFAAYKIMDKEFDICLLITDTKINQKAVSLSPVHPERGEKVFNFAGPLGLSNGTTVLLFEGYYAGVLINSKNEEYTSIYSIPATNGSSGSGILNEHGELIGVLYATMKEFDSVSLVVPYKEVKRFLKQYNLLD